MVEASPFLSSYGEAEIWEEKREVLETKSRRRNFLLKHWKTAAFILIYVTHMVILWSVGFRIQKSCTPEKKPECRQSLRKLRSDFSTTMVYLLSLCTVSSDIDIQRWVPSRFTSDYSSADASGMEQVGRNWNAIHASHGIVAVDHQWAAEHGLPLADSLQRDSSKGVYTLEAYHSLHCLVCIPRNVSFCAKLIC